jgi:hypothetical protein
LTGDDAYDSDKLDAPVRYYGIEVIVPHRSNGRIKTQDETLFEAIPSTPENRKTICFGAWLRGMSVTLKTFSECPILSVA